MADSLVHIASASVIGRPFLDRPTRLLFYFGSLLPDLAFKGIFHVLGQSTWAAEPTHSPFGLLLLCYVLAYFTHESIRKRAFFALYTGGLLHLVIDFGKDYMGSGVIMWLFPCTFTRTEAGFYRMEDAIPMGVISLCIIVAVEIVCRTMDRTCRGRSKFDVQR